jgi:hypothetical protein
VDLFNGPRSIVDYSVSVFFFTDTSFFEHFGPLVGSNFRILNECFFISSQGPRPVRACVFSGGALGLEISTSDELFEERVIDLGLQIDVACHAGGMAGPGPQDLASLKTEYTLGITPRWNGDMRDGSAKPFGSRVVKEVNWGLSHDRRAVSELRQIITKPSDELQCLSDAAAVFVRPPTYGEILNLTFLRELSNSAALRFASLGYDLDLSGLLVLNESAAEALGSHGHVLRLDGIKSLTKGTARFLSQKVGALYLDGLRDLPLSIATILSAKVDFLSLGGLEELSLELAETLARHRGTLALNGVRRLPEASAALLSQHDGQLQLKGLTDIDDALGVQLERIPSLLLKQDWDGVDSTCLARVLAKLDNTYLRLDLVSPPLSEVIKILSQFGGHLRFGSSTRVTKRMVAMFAKGSAEVSFEKLPRWRHLEEIHARALLNSQGTYIIDLNGVESISDAAAAFLLGGRHQFENYHLLRSLLANRLEIGESQARLLMVIFRYEPFKRLTLLRVKSLSQRLAAILASSGRDLEFPSVQTLDPETAESLASSSGSLSLTGLLDVSPETAAALAKHRGILNLDGLKSLTVEAASGLAGHAGALSLTGINTLSPEAAGVLQAHLGPITWHRLDVTHPEVARCMVACRRGPMNLDFLEALSEETAAVLAKARCELSLNGLTELSDSCALALSHHRGPLRLKGLKGLTPASSAALGRHRGPLYLSGIQTLSPDCAAGLSRHTGALYLPGLQHINYESAAALSNFSGPLYIRNLTGLSPECRRVLQAKPGHPPKLPKSE